VRIFDGRTSQRNPQPVISFESVADTGFSADGRWLVLEGLRSARVIRTGAWDVVAELMPPNSGQEETSKSAFTPDGHWLVAVWGSEMVLAPADRWSMIRIVFQKEPDPVFYVNLDNIRVSPDGKWVAARRTFQARQLTRNPKANPSREAEWHVWSIATGEESAGVGALIRGSEDWPPVEPQTSLKRRGQNNRWRVTAEDTVAHLWPLLPQDMIESGCARLRRNLSADEWKQQFGGDPYRPTCANLKP
jgi:hypothetical protein